MIVIKYLSLKTVSREILQIVCRKPSFDEMYGCPYVYPTFSSGHAEIRGQSYSHITIVARFSVGSSTKKMKPLSSLHLDSDLGERPRIL